MGVGVLADIADWDGVAEIRAGRFAIVSGMWGYLTPGIGAEIAGSARL